MDRQYVTFDESALTPLPDVDRYRAATDAIEQARQAVSDTAAYRDAVVAAMVEARPYRGGPAEVARLLGIPTATVSTHTRKHKERTMQVSDIFVDTDSRDTAAQNWVEALARHGHNCTVVSTHKAGDTVAVVRAENGDEYRLRMWGTKQVVATPKKATTTIEIPVAGTSVSRTWEGTGVGTWTTEKDGTEWVVHFEGSGNGVTWYCGPRGGGKGIPAFKAATTEEALKEATWQMDAKPLIEEKQKQLRA